MEALVMLAKEPGVDWDVDFFATESSEAIAMAPDIESVVDQPLEQGLCVRLRHVT